MFDFSICFKVDLRQKMKVIAERDGEKGSAGGDPVVQCQEKALFLLKFAGLAKVHIKWDVSEGT